MNLNFKTAASDVIYRKTLDQGKIESAVRMAAHGFARSKTFKATVPGWVIQCENPPTPADDRVTVLSIEEE